MLISGAYLCAPGLMSPQGDIKSVIPLGGGVERRGQRWPSHAPRVRKCRQESLKHSQTTEWHTLVDRVCLLRRLVHQPDHIPEGFAHCARVGSGISCRDAESNAVVSNPLYFYPRHWRLSASQPVLATTPATSSYREHRHKPTALIQQWHMNRSAFRRGRLADGK